MRTRVAVVVLLAALQGAAGCSSGESPARPRSASPSSPPPPSASPPSPPSTAAPRGSTDSVVMECDGMVAAERAPSANLEVVGGAVALPTSRTHERALQVSRTRLPDGSEGLFAKQGLMVRRGRHVELAVPERVADRFWLKWGRQGPTGMRVVNRCDAGNEWIAFVGGYLARKAGCLPVLVSVDGRAFREVLIGVGAPCPGQRPAPGL
ncbi:hypothetical protein ACIBCT_19845 [Streptosporangium sp. NPDC050855]|uniref:hypothetical protein n=1 Tax=Streptosporangium sp. NPDC050855 TaxID=3366194 RepID=UPI003790FC95